MRRVLQVVLASLVPIAAAGALIYELLEGKTWNPTFFLLLIILPSSLLAAGRELFSMLPPPRAKIRLQPGARAKKWEQGSTWGGALRKVTSVYIPLRIYNDDEQRTLTLDDVVVKDEVSGEELAPPHPADIKLGGKKVWRFLVCDLALEQVFNVGQTQIGPKSHVDTALAIQDNDRHQDRYELTISYTDNWGRSEVLKQNIVVDEHSNWPQRTTAWRT